MNSTRLVISSTLALVLIGLVPTSAAGPLDCDFSETVTVCMDEASQNDVPCTEDGGFESASTTAAVYVPDEQTSVGVTGSEYCYQFNGYSSDAEALSVIWHTPAGWGYLFWTSQDNTGPGYEYTFCGLDVYHDMAVIGEDYHSNNCMAVGPPNPGWGDVLPE